MLTYWLMFFIPAGMALFTSGHFRKTTHISWYIVGIVFILIIGPRMVGGDLGNYMAHFYDAEGLSFTEAMTVFRRGDPGYKFVNWLFNDVENGFYWANTVFGSIFVFGLVRFCRDQINPWVAFTVAVPYLVIVVAMGYMRQGVAIGIFMWALPYLRRGKLKIYITLIFIAALFHKTALLMMPLGFFIYGEGLLLRLLMIVPLMYGAWDLLLSEQQDKLWQNYVDVQMQSQGAKIRVIMNLIPSLLLLYYKDIWKKSFNDYTFWFWIALGSIAAVILVDFASTAVDRMALYFIPIQLVVFARLPYLAKKQMHPDMIKLLIVFGYGTVLFVWLHFALHAHMWFPYKNILTEGIS